MRDACPYDPFAQTYDVIVIGSGHAGCEAALAAARTGARTLVVSPNLDRTGYMPCNPSIGGPGKSQIVAEVDALGGAMARVADQSAMQVRQLNTSKGPAVRAVRAQCDKSLYAMLMKEEMETQERLDLLQDAATGVILEDLDSSGRATVVGITTGIAGAIHATSVVVTAGTFLRARMVSGTASIAGGEPATCRHRWPAPARRGNPAAPIQDRHRPHRQPHHRHIGNDRAARR